MERLLVLCRHGQSEWNLKDLFTGWKDPGLTEKGVEEAKAAGRRLAALGLSFDVAFTSALSRAQRTLDLVLDELGLVGLPTIRDWRLNERDYGDLSGLNKKETAEKFGAEQVHVWRRSFDVAPPGGESLKMTAERVLPYYRQHIERRVLKGDAVLVSAHGNSLRALVMALEGLSGEEIVKRELATGVPLVYRLTADGKVESYRELAA
jgi:2,3-bisphosphoglycerate-dependent phosphoglycerate mutase